MFICLNSSKEQQRQHSIGFHIGDSFADSPREDKIIEIVEKLFRLEKDGPDRSTKSAPFRIIDHENVLKERSLSHATQIHQSEMFTLRVFTTVE